MKIQYEKVFILNPSERLAFEGYLEWLRDNPIPCTKCSLRRKYKPSERLIVHDDSSTETELIEEPYTCDGYTVLDTPRDNEGCKILMRWMDRSSSFRDNLSGISDDELKDILKSRYGLIEAEKDKEAIDAQYLLAKGKVERENFSKVVMDNSALGAIFQRSINLEELWVDENEVKENEE